MRVGVPVEIYYRLKIISDIRHKPIAALVREALREYTDRFFIKGSK